MANERIDEQSNTEHVFAALADAMKELGATVQLAEIGRVTKLEAAELRAYQRNWNHPLGIVLNPSR